MTQGTLCALLFILTLVLVAHPHEGRSKLRKKDRIPYGYGSLFRESLPKSHVRRFGWEKSRVPHTQTSARSSHTALQMNAHVRSIPTGSKGAKTIWPHPLLPSRSHLHAHAPITEKAYARGVPPVEIADAKKLFGGDGIKAEFLVQDCKIKITESKKVITVDMTDAGCRNVMSIPKIFKMLMGTDPEDMPETYPSLAKFNVETVSWDGTTKEVSFTTAAKEAFELIPGTGATVEKGSLTLQLNFGKMTFTDLGLKISGKLTIGATTVEFNLEKVKGVDEGKFSITASVIKISDFYKMFTKGEEISDSKAGTNSFKDATLQNTKLAGSIGIGKYELVLTGDVKAGSDFASGKFFVIVQKDREGVNVGVIVQVNNIKPVAILKTLGFNIKELPLFKDMSLNLAIEYANGNIFPKDKDLAKVLKEIASTASITAGMKIKLPLPLKDIIAKNGGKVLPAENMLQYVNIIITPEGKISFRFPDDTGTDILNILLAIIPNFAADQLKKVFPTVTPKVVFRVFIVDLSGNVDIKIESTEKLTFGNDFLSVDKATFELGHKAADKADKEGVWTFKITAHKVIGEGVLDVTIKKEGATYTLEGKIDWISTKDLATEFKAKLVAEAITNKLAAMNVALKDPVISITFGDKLNMKVTGKAVFLTREVDFEGHLFDSKAGRALAFGIVVKNVGVNDIAKDLLETKDSPVHQIPEMKMMAQMTITIKAVNEAFVGAGVPFVNPDLKKAVGPENKDMSGLTFDALTVLPDSCGNDDRICGFLTKTLSPKSEISLSGNLNEKGISLLLKVKTDMKISDKFTLKGGSLIIKVGTTSLFALEGEMDVKLKESTVTMKAKISLLHFTTVELELTITGEYNKAFGVENLKITGFQMKVGFDFVTMGGKFGLSGEVHIGKGNKAITAQLSGEVDATTAGGFHFYANFDTLTIQGILDAFENDAKLPTAVENTGFPDGLTVGAAFPKDVFIPLFGVKLQAGFSLKGRLNIFGYEVFCEININFPKSMSLKAEFDKLELAGGAFKLTSVASRDVGPSLNIAFDIPNKTFKVQIDAYVEVLLMGVGAVIDITEKGFKMTLVGSFLRLFEAKVDIDAPYGDLNDIPAKTWKVAACITKPGELAKLTDGATEEMKERVDLVKEAETMQKEKTEGTKKNPNTIYEKALKKIFNNQKELKDKQDSMNDKFKSLMKYKDLLHPDCITSCKDKKISVGGIVFKECKIGPLKFKCPSWDPNKKLKDDPKCLIDCQASKCNAEVNCDKIMGKLKKLKKKVAIYESMKGKLEAISRLSKTLVEYADRGVELVKELGGRTKKAVEAMTKGLKIGIDKLCLSATMVQNEKTTYCFQVDAVIKLGTEPTAIKNDQQICFELSVTKAFKQIAALIVKTIFPQLGKIRSAFRELKEKFTKADKDAKHIENVDLDLEEYKIANRRTIVDREPPDPRIIEVTKILRNRVLRDDMTMKAFKDLYSDDDIELAFDRGSDETSDDERSADESVSNQMEIDPAGLSNSDEANKCKRSNDVVNVYSDILDSIHFLVGKTKKAKEECEKFHKECVGKFNDLEKGVLDVARTNNYTNAQTDNAMFYVNMAKNGTEKWKQKWNSQFHAIDKLTLKNWRNAMTEYLTGMNLNVPDFVKILNRASKETAMRWEIPSSKSQVIESLAYADEITGGLLENDDAKFSDKREEIQKLEQHVNYMKQARSELPCLKTVSSKRSHI